MSMTISLSLERSSLKRVNTLLETCYNTSERLISITVINKPLDLISIGGSLDMDDFRWGLRNFGIILSNEELGTIFNAFDRNRNGVVDFQEFISVLKGEINEKRVQLIQKAFTVLSERFKGEITFENLVKAFDAKHHPDVEQDVPLLIIRLLKC